jgi:hypothetical protein
MFIKLTRNPLPGLACVRILPIVRFEIGVSHGFCSIDFCPVVSRSSESTRLGLERR